MRCPRCGKKCKEGTLRVRSSHGTVKLVEAYSCTCGYRKGTFK